MPEEKEKKEKIEKEKKPLAETEKKSVALDSGEKKVKENTGK